LIKAVGGVKKEDGTEEEANVQTINPFSIMQEIARSVYLEDVLFGKFDSAQRFEILSLSEVSIRLEAEDLAKFLNSHLESRMFLVGHSITAADILAHAHLAEYFFGLGDFEKLQLPHAFRWLDHVQHLPGLLEEVQTRGLFVTFPDENAQAPSKSQLKKLAKKGGDNPKAAAAAEFKAK